MTDMKKRILIAISIIALCVVGSYTFELISKQQGLASAKIIKVTSNGKTAAFISGDILKKLMEQNLQADHIAKGPTLLSALNAAGTGIFSQVEIIGKGQEKPIIVKKEAVDSNLILFLESDGTVNLYKEGTGSDFLVKEITEIKIVNSK